jgi:putative PIN family toxin of toxin-antitoxin system
MRTVVDTNILVRAVINPRGSVRPVLQRLSEGAYTILYAPPMLEELADVLARPRIVGRYGITGAERDAALATIVAGGQLVVPTRRIAVCRDPKDNVFLEVAVAGRADVIVSGDDDLLVLSPFEGIPIVGAATFLGMLERS